MRRVLPDRHKLGLTLLLCRMRALYSPRPPKPITNREVSIPADLFSPPVAQVCVTRTRRSSPSAPSVVSNNTAPRRARGRRSSVSGGASRVLIYLYLCAGNWGFTHILGASRRRRRPPVGVLGLGRRAIIILIADSEVPSATCSRRSTVSCPSSESVIGGRVRAGRPTEHGPDEHKCPVSHAEGGPEDEPLDPREQ
jgi:hypothetical protein